MLVFTPIMFNTFGAETIDLWNRQVNPARGKNLPLGYEIFFEVAGKEFVGQTGLIASTR